jgi:hypothetical protein
VASLVFGTQSLPPGWECWMLGGSEDCKLRPSEACDIQSFLLPSSHRKVKCWAEPKAMRPTSRDHQSQVTTQAF